MNQRVVLRFSDVSFRYRRSGPWVVQGFSWDVGPGLNLVLGPNGSGKSTLFGLAAGWLKPKHGSVGPVAAAGASDIRVALVPQRSSAIRGFTVREQAQYVAWLGGVPSKQLHANAESALALVGLEAHASERASDLSGGQLHRLSMAGGLATQPDLIILDEPTAGLDLAARQAAVGLLQQLASTTLAVIASSHVADGLAEVADHVAVLREGELCWSSGIAEFRSLATRPPRGDSWVAAALEAALHRPESHP